MQDWRSDRIRWGFAALLLLAGCTGPATVEPSADTPSPDGEPLSAYVVNYPLKYFADRIAEDSLRVEFPVPADEDPAFWSPDAATVAAYQQAGFILLNGANYARWVQRVTLPQSKLVDTSAGFRDRFIRVDAGVTHAHGPGGEHTHGEVAFTTWLDPSLAIEQADSIRRAFTAAQPDQATAFQERFEALRDDLSELDRQFDEATRGLSGIPLFASHPVYQYFARRYGLDLQSVHFEPDEHPDETGWQELAELARAHPARWMLWEAEPRPETRSRLDQMGITSVVIDPCSTSPQGQDYLGVMQANRRRLAETISAAAPR
jgi:zinc transport system substrate-binding protein